MRLPDGSDLSTYGVMAGASFQVTLPEHGGGPCGVFTTGGGWRVQFRIPPEKFDELRLDGLAFLDVLCIDVDYVANRGHAHRLALFTAN